MSGTQQLLLGEVSGGPATYIEDVFSTYLYTGNGSTQTITNNIDLSTKGGLVWIKSRTSGTANNVLYDTARGATQGLYSNTTAAQVTRGAGLTAFTSSGFTLGSSAYENNSGDAIVSWTFRKQPKFFDVVTYTGNGSTQNIAHNLGSAPGCIIVKCTSNAGQDWFVYHRTQGNGYGLLNTTGSWGTYTGYWNNTAPTSTQFSVGTSNGVNGNGYTYVAYLFAHDAGGFGLTGTDNVISCGSFDAASVTTTTLGYEPQFLMFKRTDTTGNWRTVDNMRGWPNSGNPQELNPNLSAAETSNGGVNLIATGFTNVLGTGTYIYIAIRRGPMKVPTDATKVFAPVAYTGTSATRTITGVGFPLDMNITMDRATHTYNVLSDRLRGLTCDGSATQPQLRTNATDAEASIANGLNGTSSSAMDGYTLYGAYSQMNASPDTYISYNYRRAPSFFDEVCYTGNDTLRTISHNLGAAPEMMIIKNRDTALDWAVYHSGIGNTKYLFLNSTAAEATASTYWNNTSPTSSVFTVNTSNKVNSSPSPYVAYLFATCAGVSKVGSYTGNGTTQTINCGFAGGARFVLIKRTDSTGDWYVYDTARGMTTLTDPYLLLNSTAAEAATLGSVTTVTTGFAVNASILAAINTNGASYIFLAIA